MEEMQALQRQMNLGMALVALSFTIALLMWLREVRDKYLKRKAEREANTPEVEKLSIENGTMGIRLRHPDFARLAEATAEIMRETGGENFITMNMCDGKDMYELTCRKAEGKTPAMRIEELEDTLKNLKEMNSNQARMVAELEHKLERRARVDELTSKADANTDRIMELKERTRQRQAKRIIQLEAAMNKALTYVNGHDGSYEGGMMAHELKEGLKTVAPAKQCPR
jgi:hypothetical protein